MSGTQPLSVIVPPGGIVEAFFTVVCATTGIGITTSTTGFDSPNEYRVLVNGAQAGVVGPNATFLASRLTPGTHTIKLVVPDHCVGESPQTFVTVVNRAVTPITVRIQCGAPPQADKIAFVVMTLSGAYRITVVNS
ncbi:MAG: hypothetical protein ACR2L6_07710, partial [Gemmatimonadaceae bacterium]